MARSKIATHFTFDDHHIPVFLHKEIRNSLRFSIGKKGLIIRSPLLLKTTDLIGRAEEWCRNTLQNKPGALRSFLVKKYPPHFEISLLEKKISIQIREESGGKKDIINWNTDHADILISQDYNQVVRSKVIKDLIRSFAAKRFAPQIRERVVGLNRKHFNVNIKNVRLKYNHTNWGSCSSKGNINLSSRLLLVPSRILDYVIIHELAHRIEMNHSPRFWNIVKSANPSYKEAEVWLKKEGYKYDF